MLLHAYVGWDSVVLLLHACALLTIKNPPHKRDMSQTVSSIDRYISVQMSSAGILSLPSHSSASIQSMNRRCTMAFKPRRCTVRMEWQDCTVKREMNVPVSVAYNCYLDREATPQWMPLVSSVKIIEDKPELTWWFLKYEVLGRDLEFTWLAHYMQPIPNQKIHWRPLEGLPNQGAVRFFRKGSSTCLVELTVSYEVPQFLSPVASILQPFNENLMRRGLERFASYVKTYQPHSV